MPRLDLDWVTPLLALGGSYSIAAAEHLALALHVRHVVDLRVEACDDEQVLRVHGMRLLHLPTQDTCAVSQERLRHGVAFASEGLDRGERVLVHCQYGIGRSALLALCVLVARGEAPLPALERLKAARPVISPSPEQLEALIAFSARVRAERGARWPLPSLEDLGAVAWRHLRDDAAGAAPAAEAVRRASTRAG